RRRCACVPGRVARPGPGRGADRRLGAQLGGLWRGGDVGRRTAGMAARPADRSPDLGRPVDRRRARDGGRRDGAGSGHGLRLGAPRRPRARGRAADGAADGGRFACGLGPLRRRRRRAQSRRVRRGSPARRDQSTGAGRRPARRGGNPLRPDLEIPRPPPGRGPGGAQHRGASGRGAGRPRRRVPASGLLLARRAALD
ncbi:hypothetical protein LTR94_031011, partial [Friedmanniomyces endolithicus]